MSYTAFANLSHLIASSTDLAHLWIELQRVRQSATLLTVFNNQDGRRSEVDSHTTIEQLQEYFLQEPANSKKPRGRPHLGVISREVSLLPRHWDWLNSQPGGASATLRRLVDQNRKGSGESEGRKQAIQALDRVLITLAGDRTNYEEVTRCLYRGELQSIPTLIESWPSGVQQYVRERLQMIATNPNLSHDADALDNSDSRALSP